MNRPTRWLEEQGASPDVRALLASAGRSRALPDKTRARSIARLDRYLVWPAAAGMLFWLKGVAIAAGLGVLGVVTVAQIRPMLGPSPVVVEVATSHPHVGAPIARAPRTTAAAAPPPTPTVPAQTAPAPTVLPVEPAVAPVEQERAHAALAPVVAAVEQERILKPPPARTAPTPAPPEMDDLTREAAMLERARASLERDPLASLAELDAYATRFPSGTLRIERELLAVDALTRAGRRDEAKRRAQALLGAAGGTIYEPRVRSMLDRLQVP